MGARQQAWMRFTIWYRQAGKAIRTGVGCGALLLTCACAGVGLGGCGSPHGPSVSQSTATSRPNATATQPVAQSGAAVLGGPGQAFIAKYGPLTSQSNATQGDLHFKQYPGVAADFLIVQTGKYVAIAPGDTDAYSIAVAPPPDQDWTATAAKQTCAAFMPADAHSVKQVVTTDPTSKAVDGLDDIYLSASLATIFPASAFQDANQNQAQAGLFDVWYLHAKEGDSSQIASCTIMVGEQQTQG